MDQIPKTDGVQIINNPKLLSSYLAANNVGSIVNAVPTTVAPVISSSGVSDLLHMDPRQFTAQMQIPFTMNTPEGQILIQSSGSQQALPQNYTMASSQQLNIQTSESGQNPMLFLVPEDVVTITDPTVILPTPTKSKAKGITRVVCPECNKTFSCGANLRDHLRLHTGEKPYKCSECPKEFAQRSNWRLHKRVHTGERPFMCGICGKTFARSSHLPGHVRMHTGERPYPCDQCSAQFSSAQSLKNHSRTHTGEKPYVCNFCDTAFTHSSSLSSHKKKCTGYRRRRGRPVGTGPRASRKKKEGTPRPRGRPKKKVRLGRGRKKILIEDDPSESIEEITYSVENPTPSKVEIVSNAITTENEGVNDEHDGIMKVTDGIDDDSDEPTKEAPLKVELPLNCELPVEEELPLELKYKIGNGNITCTKVKPIYDDGIPTRGSARLRRKQELKDARKLSEDTEQNREFECKDIAILEEENNRIVVTEHDASPESQQEQLIINSHNAINYHVAAPNKMIYSTNSPQIEHIMTNLNHQHGVLNLTQHSHLSPVVSLPEAITTADSINSPVVTFVSSIDLANSNGNVMMQQHSNTSRVPQAAHQQIWTERL